MRRHFAAGILAPALAVALLSGCAATPDEPEASNAPSATASEEPAAAVTPTCETLWTAEYIDRAAAVGYTLNTEWTGATEAEGFSELVPFVDNGGIVCIWGSPEFPEQPVAYAWSAIDAEQSLALQNAFDAEGLTRTEVTDGVAYAREATVDTAIGGYLFRDGDWFFTTDFADLEPMAARFDAL